MIRLRSVTTSATEAAKTSVSAPIAGGDVRGRGRQLEQRVHARDQVDARRSPSWRRGSGPRPASGPPSRPASQVWSGICADFANAPTRISRQIATIAHSFCEMTCGARANTPVVVERARVALDQDRGEHEADVADDVDHERLHARVRSRCGAGTRS